MIQPLHIEAPEDKVAFFSDFHANHNHPFIYQPRGFTSMLEHDETYIECWNEVCDNNTIVFHLGDMVSSDPKGQHFKNLLRRLRFKTLYALPGNHPSGFKAVYYEEMRTQCPDVFAGNGEVYPLDHHVDRDPNKRVIFLPQYAEAHINDQLVVLCHFPIVSHAKMAKKSWMLTGHSHGNCQLTAPHTGKGYRLDVGALNRPLTMVEVRNLLKDREIDSWDHHGVDAEEAGLV